MNAISLIGSQNAGRFSLLGVSTAHFPVAGPGATQLQIGMRT